MRTNTTQTIITEAQTVAAELKQLDAIHRDKLAELVKQHKQERATLVQELADLNRVLRALKSEPVGVKPSTATGKPLSDAHKQAIKDAFQRRAAAKAAATSGANLTLTAPPSHAEDAPEEQSEPAAKKAPAKKAVR